MRMAIAVLLALAAIGCAERRTAGLQCASDRDCVAPELCDTGSAVCGPPVGLMGTDAARVGPSTDASVRPDARPPHDAAPVNEGPGFWEAKCTLWPEEGWPEVVLLGPRYASNIRIHEFDRIARDAAQLMGRWAPTIAVCISGEGIGDILRMAPPDSPSIVVGPYEPEPAGALDKVLAEMGAMHLRQWPPLHDGWTLAPRGESWAPWVAAGLAALPESASIAVIQRPMSAFAERLVEARCGADADCAAQVAVHEVGLPMPGEPWGERAAAEMIGEADLIIVESAHDGVANTVARVALALPHTPAVLVLDTHADPFNFDGLVPDEAPERACQIRVLTVAGPGAASIGVDFERSRLRTATDEARAHDGMLLAGLLTHARGAGPSTAANLDPLLRTLLGGAGPLLELDAEGWADIVERIDDGLERPRLMGAANASIPDPDTREPPIRQARLLRLKAENGRQGLGYTFSDAPVIVDGVLDAQAFGDAWFGDDCAAED